MTNSTYFRSPRYNKLKKHALEVFEHHGGWLSPRAWAVLAGFYPVRAAYSYLLRLHRFGLLDRAHSQRSIIYRLSIRGKGRLAWLKQYKDGAESGIHKRVQRGANRAGRSKQYKKRTFVLTDRDSQKGRLSVSKQSVNPSDSNRTKGEQTREKIVVKALHLAAREGLGTLSIGKLARKVGMSKSGLFLHCGSKRNLEAAGVKHAEDLFFQHVLQPLEGDRLKGIERLWRLCELWLKFVEGRVLPGNYFFNGALFHCAEQDGAIAQRIREIVWQWLKALRQAVEQGQWMDELVKTVDAKQTALELNGLLLTAQWCHVLEEEDGTHARSAILAKLASVATEKIPGSAFDSVGVWRRYLEDRQA